jgi:putative peptidoglycan lipid II flippase
MLRSARIVVLLAVLVQIAAFARTAVIAALFGASIDVDSYNLGVVAPTFIATVIGGWLQIGFVGRYAGLLATGDLGLATAYRTRMLILVLLISLAAAVLCVSQPYRLMMLFLPDTQNSIALTSANALRVTGWTLLPTIVGDFLGLVLNSHGRFFAAALAPLVNAVVSVIALWLWPASDLSALVWTLLLGNFFQLLVVAISVCSIRIKFSLDSDAVRGEVLATIAIALPLLPAVIFSNSAAAILQFRSAELGEGAVAILGYASKLHAALSQVIVIGLGTVLLPHFGTLWARNDKDQIVILLRRLTRASILLCSYLCVGIYLMGEPTVGLLFARGAFDIGLAQRVAELWMILSLSLFPFAIGTFIAKFCQALRKSITILLSGAISFAVIWFVSLIGARSSSLPIITLSSTMAFSATAVFWLSWLSRTVKTVSIWGDILGGALRVLVALAPAIVLDLIIQRVDQSAPSILEIATRGTLFSLVIVGSLRLFGYWRWFLGKDIS